MARTVFEFTETERAALNECAKRNYQDMTADEVLLYAEWNAAIELSKDEYESEKRRLDSIVENEIQARHEEHEAAMANLQALHEIALARLERIRGGNGK